MDETLSKGELTRLQIIEAAHALFIRQGFHGTSMRDIASDAGIALGGIYNHFVNKEEIFEAVFINYHPVKKVVPAVMQAKGETTEDLLRDIARLMVEGLKSQPEFINLLFIDIVEFQGRFMAQTISNQIPFFDQVYRRLTKPTGPQIRPFPPLVIARSFFGLFFSYYMTGIFLNTNPNIPREIIDENVLDYFVDIYLHGILIDDKPD